MPIFVNLRVRLQTRKNRVVTADYQLSLNELKLFLRYINNNSFLNNLLKELPPPPVPAEEMAKEIEKGTIRFPESEIERVSMYKSILEWCSEDVFPSRMVLFARNFAHSSNYNDCVKTFMKIYLEPFYDYLDEHIDDCDSILYLLWKFKNQCEWFNREKLYEIYINNTEEGEGLLKKELQKFLFEQGIDYPFSEPLSPSGRADLVAELQSMSPLVLELKLFDPQRRKDRKWIRQGFRQVLDYAKDYNKSIGYLIILNLTDTELVLNTREKINWPPRVKVGDKTIFLIVIDLMPKEVPASKRGTIRIVEIDESFLLS